MGVYTNRIRWVRSVKKTVRLSLDMLHKVFFGSGLPDGGGQDLPGGHFKIGNQALGSMTDVFKLPTLDLSGFHRQLGMESFQRLNTSHFVHANHMHPNMMQDRSLMVEPIHGSDLFLEGVWIGGASVQPWLTAVGAKIGFILKNGRFAEPRCREQSRAQ